MAEHPPGPRLHAPLVTAFAVGGVGAVATRYMVWRQELPLAIGYRLGYSGRALLGGRWWNVVSSQLLTRDKFMAASIIVSLAVMLGGYELLVGTRRALVVAVAGGVAGPTVVTGVLALGSIMHWDFATRTLSTLDYGASAMTAAGGGALVAVIASRRLRLAALLFVLGGLVVHHQLADWEHLVAFPLGYGLARWMGRPEPALAARRAPRGVLVRWTPRVALPVAALVGAVSITLVAPIRAVPASAAAAGSRAARVLDVTYPTPSLGGHRRVIVVLPVGAGDGRRFPVLEILHGRPGRPDDALTGLDLLNDTHATSSAILVVPDGHGPVVADGDFADIPQQRLGTALSDDLRRWVDTTFPTDGRWAVTGYSAGGYGAAYLATVHGVDYQLACPMSGYYTARDPAFVGQPAAVRDAASPLLHTSTSGPRMLLVTGTSDREAMNEAANYAAALSQAGQRFELLKLPGAHSNDVWRPGIDRCLQLFTSAAGA